MAYEVGEESFTSIEDEWRELLPRSSSDNIFLTPEWQRAWWSEFGNADELLLLAVRRDSDLVAVVPLRWNGATISFLCDPQVCDYLDFLIADGAENEVCEALIDYLGHLSWQVLDLSNIPHRSHVLSTLAPLVKSQGYRVNVLPDDPCPSVKLPHSWEQYLSGLSTKDRHELQRKLRRLSTRRFCYYVIDDRARLMQDLEDFFRLHRQSREDKAQFMNFRMSRFFREISATLMGQKQLRLFFLEVDGVRVSTALCFEYGNELLLYNSGYDPEYRHLSVGLLLKAFCIKQAIEWHNSRFDFLRGGEQYKYHLGGQDQPLHRLVVQRER